MGEVQSQPAKASLSLWDTASLIVGIIVGVGIYRNPAVVFANLDSAWLALSAWLLGGLLSLVGAFCFAELASTYPRSGGEYVYLSRAYGRPLGFLFAWAQFAVIRPGATIAVIAYLFGDFAGRFGDVGREQTWFFVSVATAVIIFPTIINIVGVRLGKHTQNVLTLLKILGIGGILFAGFFFGRAGELLIQRGTLLQTTTDQIVLQDAQQQQAFAISASTVIVVEGKKQGPDDRPFTVTDLQPGMQITLQTTAEEPATAGRISARTAGSVWDETSRNLRGLSLAMILVLWTYAGWHEAAYVVAEIHDQRRTIPRALMLGTGLVVALYLLMNLAYLHGLGLAAAGDSPAIAADVLALIFGERGARVMSLLVMLSTLGALHGAIFTSSRIFTEIGTDHPLFAPLGRWNKRLGTPVVALLVQGVLSVGYVLFVGCFFRGESGFDAILNCTAAVFWLFFLLTGIALFVLRWKDPQAERPFITPLFPLTPIIFCLACLGMLLASISYDPFKALLGILLLLTGVPLYFLSNTIQRKNTGAEAK